MDTVGGKTRHTSTTLEAEPELVIETRLTISVSQYTTTYNNNVPYLLVQAAIVLQN